MSIEPEGQALLDAAWRVLERSNFESCKIERVMKEASVSARQFYRHFADKDELLLALMRDEMQRSSVHLTTAVRNADGPVAQVRIWISAVIGAVADPRRRARAGLFSAQQSLIRKFPEELSVGSALLMEPLRAALVAGIADGTFPWADPDRDVPLIYSLTGGVMVDALARTTEQTVAERIDVTTAFVLRSLGVPPDR